jgi:hypothetical protein
VKALVLHRQEGKTTQLMGWVKDGVRVEGYPGWSRVAVVIDRRRHDRLKHQYWDEMEDFDHRVYTLREIQTGRLPRMYNTAYRLDDLDAVLSYFFPGLNIDGFTMTGSTWASHPSHSV